MPKRGRGASSERTIVLLLLQQLLGALALCQLVTDTASDGTFHGSVSGGMTGWARQIRMSYGGLQLPHAPLQLVDPVGQLANLLLAREDDADVLHMHSSRPHEKDSAVSAQHLQPIPGRRGGHTLLNRTAVNARLRRELLASRPRVEMNWRQLRCSASRTTARARSSALSPSAGRQLRHGPYGPG